MFIMITNKNYKTINIALTIVLLCFVFYGCTSDKTNTTFESEITTVEAPKTSESVIEITTEIAADTKSDSEQKTEATETSDTEISESDDTVLIYLPEDKICISEDMAFYELIAKNPIDSTYPIEYSENTTGTVASVFENRKNWQAQIDHTLANLKEKLDDNTYTKLTTAYEKWIEYSDLSLKVDQKLFYADGICGSSSSYVQTGLVARQRTQQFATVLLSIEYSLTGECDFITDNTGTVDFDNTFDVYSLSIYTEGDFGDILDGIEYFDSGNDDLLITCINSICSDVVSYSEDQIKDDLENAVQAYLDAISALKEVESELGTSDERVNDIYTSRLNNLFIELTGKDRQLKQQLG